MNYDGSRKTNIIVKISLAAIICVCIASIVKLEVNYNGLKDETAELKSQISTYNDEIELLQEELAEEQNDDYVMRIAREKLGYCMPDEIIYYNNSIE